MDSSAATAPLVVLGVAGLGLFLVTLAAVLLPRRRRPPAPSGTVEDDLPAFHAHPPGSPGAPARAAPAGGQVRLTTAAGALAPAEQPPGPDEGLRVARFVLALAALALALVAAAAAVALPSARADRARPTAPQSGASWGDTDARLSFGSAVLEQHAVGVTMTRPEADLSISGRRALLHLRLPTWNCLAPEAPDDPVEAGCVPSVTEYGDLPSPALSTSSDGRTLLLQGRVATYTRPNGSGPVDTGRVYDVTLTLTPGRRLGPGRYVADGVLTLGSGATRTDGDPAMDMLTRGR